MDENCKIVIVLLKLQMVELHESIEKKYFSTGRNTKLYLIKNSLLFQLQALKININVNEFFIIDRELFSSVR